jgi:hypothetical protein
MLLENLVIITFHSEHVCMYKYVCKHVWGVGHIQLCTATITDLLGFPFD